jgi:hypothetical protein
VTPVAVNAVSAVSTNQTQVARQTTNPTRDKLAVPNKKAVTVNLTPEARQHLSRLEAFTATIGTPKQPKTMGPPGMSLDVSA